MSNKLANKKETLVTVLGVSSLVLVLLASICNFIPYIINYITAPYVISYMLPSGFAFCFKAFMCGSLLPISLLLLKGNVKRKGTSIIFAIIAVLFIIVQLLSAVFAAAQKFATFDFLGVSYIVSDVAGNELFLFIARILGVLSFGKELTLSDCVSTFFYSLGALFYVLPNLLCLVGFIKLSFTKKPVTQETENIAE